MEMPVELCRPKTSLRLLKDDNAQLRRRSNCWLAAKSLPNKCINGIICKLTLLLIEPIKSSSLARLTKWLRCSVVIAY
ncbi:hypothetical protein M514_21082 [Trichuris suis]|uniref:Uncharacterized protein n=1 Tax=Trichuris suis TaxID=68888 RepID=A0A085NB87_9BILA|nr:hypothetical protein M514_21082 [Trichuris suis]